MNKKYKVNIITVPLISETIGKPVNPSLFKVSTYRNKRSKK